MARKKSASGPAAWWQGIVAAYRSCQTGLSVVGLLSFISLLVIFSLRVRRGPPRFTPSAAMPGAGSPEFVQLLSNSMPLPVDRGPPIRILENGDAFRSA